MTCEYCGYKFQPGEHVKQVFTYWREDHLGGEAYQAGTKPAGWAHMDC